MAVSILLERRAYLSIFRPLRLHLPPDFVNRCLVLTLATDPADLHWILHPYWVALLQTKAEAVFGHDDTAMVVMAEVLRGIVRPRHRDLPPRGGIGLRLHRVNLTRGN